MSNNLKIKAIQQEFMQESKPAILEEIFRLSNQLITGGYRAAMNHNLYFHMRSTPIICHLLHVSHVGPPNMTARRLE